MTGVVFDLKEMAVHDGDGVRLTVFMKGCPLRCEWCHNPEGLSKSKELLYKKAKCTDCGVCKKSCTHEECKPFGRCLHVCPNDCLSVCGEEYTPERLAKKIMSYKRIFDACGGGVTFSGGEPLFQSAFLFETLKNLTGVHKTIETCAFTDKKTFEKVIREFDFVIMDVKIFDDELHKKYTGASNAVIKENFQLIQKSGKPYLIRTPLIKGKTDDEKNLKAIQDFIGDSQWELLPENHLAKAKRSFLTKK